MSSTYFTRHGRKSDTTNALSQRGKKGVEEMYLQLEHRGFTPSYIFSSSTPCSIQTAHILAPQHAIQNTELLERDGTAKQLRWAAEKILYETLYHTKLDTDALFVCHGAMATSLAILLLKGRGVNISFDRLPLKLTRLKQGCGILVTDDQYTFMSPYESDTQE